MQKFKGIRFFIVLIFLFECLDTLLGVSSNTHFLISAMSKCPARGGLSPYSSGIVNVDFFVVQQSIVVPSTVSYFVESFIAIIARVFLTVVKASSHYYYEQEVWFYGGKPSDFCCRKDVPSWGGHQSKYWQYSILLDRWYRLFALVARITSDCSMMTEEQFGQVSE